MRMLEMKIEYKKLYGSRDGKQWYTRLANFIIINNKINLFEKHLRHFFY